MGTRRSVCVRACVGAQAPMGLRARVCMHARALVCWQQGAWCWGWLDCRGRAPRGGSQPWQSVLSGRGLESSGVRCAGGGSAAAGVPGRRGLNGRGVRWAGGVLTAAGCAALEVARLQRGCRAGGVTTAAESAEREGSRHGNAPAVPRGEGSGEDGRTQERVRVCVCWGAGADGAVCACVCACERNRKLAAGCVVLGMARLPWGAPQGGSQPRQSVLSGRGLDSSGVHCCRCARQEGSQRPEGTRQRQGVLCWRWLDCSGDAEQEGSRLPQRVQSGRGLDSSRVCCAGGGSTAAGVLAGGVSTAAECAEREGSRQQRDALCWRWLNCSEGAGRRGRRGIGRGRGGCGAWREWGKAQVAWW